MSELVARLCVQQLRNKMFPTLPKAVQDMFPTVQDTIVQQGSDEVPNIVVGEYSDFGVNTPTPMIAVSASGPQEGIVNVYRHLKLSVDMWIGGDKAGNVEGRRIVSIIYEHVNRFLQNVNWTGQKVQIERCYEEERSPIMFDPTGKVYRIANIYRVEALSAVWY
jgi:hypothetical protein